MISSLKNHYTRFRLLAKNGGYLAATRYTLAWLGRQVLNRDLPMHRPQVDVEDFYAFTVHSEFGDAQLAKQVSGYSINWVIPDFGIGSGGHLNIFRLIQNLEKHGFICRIVIVGDCQFSSANDARASINKHFFKLNAEISIGTETLKPAWACVATSWQTAYRVRNFLSTQHKIYFVQDYEPYFYAMSSEYAFAQHTYDFGFLGITAGDWLADKLAQEHGMKTFSYRFSYDREHYSVRPGKDSSTQRIFYYARPVTPRRGFELGLMALEEVCRQLPEVEVVLAGWDVSNYRIGFKHLNAGVVALDELADLYSQCDFGLVISFTNISLLPLELMACGCPVVSNRGPNTEWLLNSDNAVLSEASVGALSSTMVGLLRDHDRLREVRNRGLAFAATTDWGVEAERVANYFEALRNEA